MNKIPLIQQSGSLDMLTPMERSVIATEQIITSIMVASTLSDPSVTDLERVLYTTLSSATVEPAEA